MKHEKYIHERKTAKGSRYLQIHIDYKDEMGQKKVFYQNVIISDFDSPGQALKAAVLLRDQALAKIQKGACLTAAPTVKVLFEKKFELLPVSLRTQQKHRTHWNKGIRKLASVPIDKVTTAVLQKNVNEYVLTHTDNATSNYISCWADLFLCAQMLGFDVPDRTKLIRKPKSKVVKTRRSQTVSNEDFMKLLDALPGFGANLQSRHLSRMIWYMLQIGYYTGMRPAEILAIGPKDITSSGIVVNKAVGSSSTERLAIIPTKTNQSVRVVPIHPDLRPVLDQLLVESRTVPLLTDLSGRLLDVSYLSNIIYKVAKSAGVEFHSYMLRHGFASDLVKSVDPRTLQDLMGHASFSMSIDYARSTEDDRAHAVDSRKLN